MGDEWKKAFKAAFKQKEAEEQAAAEAQKQAVLAKAKAEGEAATAKLAEQQAKNLLTLAEKNKKSTAEKITNLKADHQTAQQDHQKAKDAVLTQDNAIKSAAADEAKAKAEKEEIARAEKRGEYSMTIKVYKRRLAAANLPNALDEHFKKLQPLYIEDKFDELKKALAKADDALLAAVAATETAATQADRLKRLEALKRKPFENNQDVRSLGKQLAETAKLVEAGKLLEALTVLERELTPMLAACETDADAYENLLAEVDERLGEVQASEFRSEKLLGEVAGPRKQAAHAAHTGTFAKANEWLGAAEAKLVDAEEAEIDNRQDAPAYPGALAQVEKDTKDFFSVPANKSFKAEYDKKVGSWIKAAALNAGGKPGQADFSSALLQLDEAAAELVGLVAKAQAVKDKLDDKAQLAAQLAAQQAAKQLAAQAAAAAKLAAETVLAPSSLAAIGKNHIDKWVVQLQRLMAGPAPVCSLSGGTTTFWLAGNTTVESICTVRAASGALVDTFVVHYHPSAKFSDPGGSPLHAKPRRGNATTPHHYMNDGHWLVADGHVKSFATVRSEGY